MSSQPDYIARYELENMKLQMVPAQLNSRVFFGPLNSLTNLKFITDNNIKHFITVNIPTSLSMKYCEKIPLSLNEYTLLNFDSNLPGSTDGMNESLVNYSQVYSSILTNFIKNQLPDCADSLYSTSSLQHLANNIVTCVGYERLTVFNDFMTILHASDRNIYGNCLVVSSNGNDEDLFTLLVSIILKENITLDLDSVIQHIQTLRPSMRSICRNKIQYYQGFIQYCELIKSKSWNTLLRNEQLNRERKKVMEQRNFNYKRFEQESEIELSCQYYDDSFGDSRSDSEHKLMTPTSELDQVDSFKQQYPNRAFKRVRYLKE
ncbi:hypothetical protein HANVADRAFT_53485 [Hanseniaspora valbyensis NRRL Y-1626]|uniref:Phosphatases II n=1 Tax=Hanseniaspora valbyensis NRRL Y-1626 TaxID=766949 RepID=A0A1B7TB79_9ASCO|nr:hypothetical protein HANVADRAFT_53485 [Hanseniaspora valbyensis NRRL Y-1626]